MKNREYQALIALAMTVSMTLGSLGTVPAVYAKEPDAAQEIAMETKIQNTDNKETENTKSGDTKALKDETVYAKIDGTGAVRSVTVSDELKNVKDIDKIQDVSSLQNIENVKGEETFAKDSDTLTWNGAGEEICYQGTTTQKLPIGIQVTYQLAGKEISPEELEGKSGHLTVRYQYQNATGKDGKEYVPFLMVTGLILDEGKYTNVSVTNGKQISDGDREMIIGMGLPDMQENLGANQMDIPDYFEFEADVTEYEPLEGITVATNEIFNELEADGFDSLSDLKGAMQELQDASNRLVSGSGELKNGIAFLLSSSGSLVDGVDRLAAGGITLKEGTGQLAEGSKTLAQGNQRLSAGLLEMQEQTQSNLLPGVQQLDNGVSGMQEQLGSEIPVLSQGAKQLADGLQNIKAGTSGISTVLNSGTQDTGNVSLNALAAGAATDARNLCDALAQTQTTSVNTDGVVYGNGGTDEALNILYDLLENDSVKNDPEAAAAVNQAIGNLTSDQAARQTAANELKAEIQGQSDNTVADAAKLAQEAGVVSAVVNQLSGTAATVDAGVDTALAGAEKLNAGVNDPEQGLITQLNGGISQLKNGTSALRNGIEGESGLLCGMNQLSEGAKTAAAGSETLSAGMKNADTGAKTLTDGLYTLKYGSGELIGGISQLDEGAGTLSDGMLQFHEDGIEKLVSVFDGDISGLLDHLNGMLEASRGYHNFSGISDEMDGRVKFIFVSE